MPAAHVRHASHRGVKIKRVHPLIGFFGILIMAMGAFALLFSIANLSMGNFDQTLLFILIASMGTTALGTMITASSLSGE